MENTINISFEVVRYCVLFAGIITLSLVHGWLDYDGWLEEYKKRKSWKDDVKLYFRPLRTWWFVVSCILLAFFIVCTENYLTK